MAELSFAVESAAPQVGAVAPALALVLRVQAPRPDQAIAAALLHCHVRIDALERRYTLDEETRLQELFGDPGAWGRSTGAFSWTQLSLALPSFTGSTTVPLPLPCGYDFGVAAQKYLYALAAGDIPLTLLFAGTVFEADPAGELRVLPLPRSHELHYRLPVATLRATLEQYYPQQAVLTLSREVFERLYRYRLAHGLRTWEQAVERLLQGRSVIS